MSRSTEEQKAFDDLMSQQEQIEAPCDASQFRIFRRMAENESNFFAIGFGGGSVPGLAANTALMGLIDELKLRPFVKEVWGTSAGSIVAGAMACGLTSREMLPLLQELDRPGVVDIPRWQVLGKGLLRFLFRQKVPDGFVRGEHFRRALIQAQPVRTFEETQIPLRMIACTDDGNARKVVLRSGPLVEAGMASMCIPGVMMPVQDWNGQSHGYLDGGVVEKTPLVSIIEDHCRLDRSQDLLAVTTHFSPRKRRPEGFVQRFVSTIDHMEEVSWEHQRAQARETPNCKPIILNPQLEFGGMFDFSYVQFNYLWARRSFKQQLSNAGLATRFDAR